jgi:hypothetical protein
LTLFSASFSHPVSPSYDTCGQLPPAH